MKIKDLINLMVNFPCSNQHSEIRNEQEIQPAPHVLKCDGEGLPFPFPLPYHVNDNETYQQDYVPQSLLVCQNESQSSDKTARLPSIYSGIGLGVYQGEVVTFRQMAVGEKHWVVSKLRFEDLRQLPSSILSEVCLLLCLLCLNNRQSDLVKMDLQMKGGIELMKSYCPQADSLDKSLSEIMVYNNLSPEDKPTNQQQQSQYHPECLIIGIGNCPFMKESNIKRNESQLKSVPRNSPGES